MPSRLPKPASRLFAGIRRWSVQRRFVRPLLESVPRGAMILEIGGGYNPRFVKEEYPRTHHLDHCSTEELRTKYAAVPEVAHLVHRIQPVDFVFTGAPIETVIPSGMRFDVIYGSHVLEHQVDLVGHLQSLERMLAQGGRLIEIVPDFRCCFDVLRYPSLTSDALLAHWRAAPLHSGKQVFDAMSREVDRNPGRAMRAKDIAELGFRHALKAAYDATLAAERPGQAYADLHAWTFCPESFRLLMIELRMLGLTCLQATQVSPTYGNQFCAVLELAEASGDALAPQTAAAMERERLALSKQLRL